MAGQMPVVVVSPLPPWTAVRHRSRNTRKVSTVRPGLAHFLPAMLVPILPLCYCHLIPSIGRRCSPMGPTGPSARTSHVAPILIHLLRCTTITPAAATTDLLLPFHLQPLFIDARLACFHHIERAVR